MTPVTKTLSELAWKVGEKVVGDGQVVMRNVAPIEKAGPGEITFLANPHYHSYLAGCRASAVIVRGGTIKDNLVGKYGNGYLEVDDPFVVFAQILRIFTPPVLHDGKISSLAYVDPTASLGEGATLFPSVFVGPAVRVGRRYFIREFFWEMERKLETIVRYTPV